MGARRSNVIDEPGASTVMAHLHRRFPRGQSLKFFCPHGHWKTTTFVGGLTKLGFAAPYVLDGPIDGAVFNAWKEKMLAPRLKSDDIVILNNLSSHKVAAVRDAVAAKGAEVPLPAAILAGSQSARERLRKTKIVATQSCRVNKRRSVETDWKAARQQLRKRMSKLHPEKQIFTLSVERIQCQCPQYSST